MRIEFVDKIIVALAHSFFRGVMAIGTLFVYIQFFALALAGIAILVVVVIAIKNALLGG